MTETATSPTARIRWATYLPAIVFFAAFFLRLPGLGWGLKNDLHNQSYHPDEAVIWSYSQQIDPLKGKFTPGFYNYPTFYLTGLKVVSDMTASYTGSPDPQSIDSQWAFVSRVHHAARFLTAVAGALTALFVFLMLRRRVGEFGAVCGGLLIAVAPAHVMHSRFQTVDVLATLFLTVSTYFALAVFDAVDRKSLMKAAILSGVFAGLSAGTKYTGILALLTLMVAIALRPKSETEVEGSPAPEPAKGMPLIAAILLALITFVVVTPGAVLDNAAFMRDLRYEMAHTASGHELLFVGTGSGFSQHLGNLLYGVGGLLTALGLIGLGLFSVKRAPWALAVLAFFLPYYLLIGRAEVAFMRYTFPLYVGLGVGFGALMAEAHRRKGRWLGIVPLGFLALAGVDSRALIGTLNGTLAMNGEDSRDRAARMIKAEPNSTVGLARDPWTWSVPMFRDSTAMRGMSLRDRLYAMQEIEKAPVMVVVGQTPEGKPTIPDFDSRLITDLKPDRIAMTALEFDARERLVGRTDIPSGAQSAARQYKAFMEALAKDYTLEKQFGTQSRVVEDMMYVDPVVLVWKRKPAP